MSAPLKRTSVIRMPLHSSSNNMVDECNKPSTAAQKGCGFWQR